MDVKQVVADFGTDAVVEYRRMAAIKNETRIPEMCLSLHIASRLITDRKWDAQVEVPYSNILRELGVKGAGLTSKFGGQRADIAIYENGIPSSIIEIKIIDEGRKIDGVSEDWKKISQIRQELSQRGLPSLSGYVGALVCDVSGKLAESAVDDLSQLLKVVAVHRGDKTQALSGQCWGWLFVCAQLS